jgi:serine/threonine-protein kinase
MYVPASSTTVMRRPATDRQRQRQIAYILLALAVIGLFILAAWGAKHLFSNSGGSGIATPAVIGLTQDQAIAAIQTKGLKVGQVTLAFIGTANCNQPKGKVCDQNPVGGIALNRGSAVNLTVSGGAQQVQVPSVVDLSRDDATKALKDAKLVVGKITPRDDPAKAGTVLGQTPLAGTTVDAGSKVDLVVASGNAPLPDVVGQTYTAASATLQQAGFKVSPSSVTDPNALVTAQNPPGGGTRTAPRGSTITLTVVQPTPTPTPAPTPTPPTTGPFP